MRLTRWLVVGLAFLLVFASAARADDDRRPAMVQFEHELQALDASLADRTDKTGRKVRRRVGKLLRIVAKSNGDLRKDASLIRRAGGVVRASHDSPEEVQMQLLIFGVIARTADDLDAVATSVEAVLAAADGLLPPGKLAKARQRMQKARDRLNFVREDASLEAFVDWVKSVAAGKSEFRSGRAVATLAKRIDQCSPLIANAARRATKVLEQDPELGGLPFSELSPLAPEESATVGYPLLAFDIATIAHEMGHNFVRADAAPGGGDRLRFALAAGSEGGPATVFLFHLTGAAAAPGFTGTVPATGQTTADAVVAVAATDIFTTCDCTHLVIARPTTGSVTVDSVENGMISGSATFDSFLDAAPPIVIVFNLLLPAVQAK